MTLHERIDGIATWLDDTTLPAWDAVVNIITDLRLAAAEARRLERFVNEIVKDAIEDERLRNTPSPVVVRFPNHSAGA